MWIDFEPAVSEPVNSALPLSPVDALVEQMERLRVGLFGMTEQEEIEAVRRCHNRGR
jgi:hypothetical protein